MSNVERIKALEEQIKILREQDEEAREARREATKKVWRFFWELVPAEKSWDKIWDPNVVMYTLRGEIQNKEEMLEAGYSADDVRGGVMRYLFNKATGRIIMSIGGGHIFIPDRPHSKGDVVEVVETLTRIEGMVKDFPDQTPMDVTEIIVSQKSFRW